jgi:hypothetical protein
MVKKVYIFSDFFRDFFLPIFFSNYPIIFSNLAPMKKILPFILTGGAIILFYFLNKKATADRLKVIFKNIHFKKSTGAALPDIFAEFLLINGTNTPLSITSIVGDIFINGKSLSTIQYLQKLDIPANSTSTLNIKVITPILSLLSVAYNLIIRKQKFSATFKGTLNSNGILLPIEQDITVN